MQPSHFSFQSLVPVRAEPDDRAEMVTQLLFGDLVGVLEEQAQWRRVQNASDGYEGWIDEKMIFPLATGFLENTSHWEMVLSESVRMLAKQHGTGFPAHLLPGSKVPVPKGLGEREHIRLEFGPLELVVPRSNLQPILREGRGGVLRMSELYLFSPYLWGGKSPWGIDCSGLTQMAYALCGVAIPRDASQQVSAGRTIDFAAQEPGDLAFFRNAKGRIHHVGLVLEGGEIRHAHGNVHDDWLTEKGIVNKSSKILSHELFSIVRID